jgi:DNA recombination protein RmuC
MIDTLINQLTQTIADQPLLALGSVIATGFVIVIALLLRPRKPVADPAAEQRIMEINANLHAMGQLLAAAQSQLQQTVNQRLDAVTQNLGESMKTTAKHTSEHLQQLHSRLAVIDSAQKNIGELTTQVTSLQQILSNKQSRGAFGQAQLEALVADVLPKGAYEFQYKLSNGKMPDCAIFMPDNTHLVIDAKFPLEAVTSLRNATNDEERKQATARVKQDIIKHVVDISEKYLIPGETQDIALMFIPSESVYAELYERFEEVMQRAHRKKVMIVSPTLMVLAIQVIKQLRKDAQMREAVGLIQRETGHMLNDVRLLCERVNKLKGHFGQTAKDIDDILTSAGKIERRAGKIEELEFEGEAQAELPMPVEMTRTLRAAE